LSFGGAGSWHNSWQVVTITLPDESSQSEKLIVMNKKPISKTRRSQKSRTNWQRVDAMQDKDIDASDIPKVSPEKFAAAIVRKGLKALPAKQQITLRIDADVLDWFRRSGSGYQTQINRLLRAYVDAHQASK
jgi:uncharacterized protein (DUF4415 family)